MRKLLIHFLYVKKNSSVGVESSAGNLLKRSMISLASETVVVKADAAQDCFTTLLQPALPYKPKIFV